LIRRNNLRSRLRCLRSSVFLRCLRPLRYPAAAAALVVLGAVSASAQRTLVIDRFNAKIAVAADGSITVEEVIQPTFTGSWNGIYRTIPVEYRTPQGLNYTLRLTFDSITDGAGDALKWESSRERHYRKLKIWVPGAQDTTKTVVIRYRVANGLRFFEEHDELYWNVTGDEWDVPIQSASAEIRLPAGATGIRAAAFTGGYGSTDKDATVAIEPPSVRIKTTAGLSFREGLTAVVGWDPGIVQRPTAVDRVRDTALSNLPLLIPPLVFVGMWRLWSKRGRDPEMAPVQTRYEPPDGMSPAELGTLVDGTPDMRDLTSTLVDLAVRGYLRIDVAEDEGFFGLFSSKDYLFTLKKPRTDWPALKPHESSMLAAMFSWNPEQPDMVRLSSLKNKFYKHVPGLKEMQYKLLVDGGYYTGRPDRVRMGYIFGGIAFGVVIAFAGTAFMTWLGMQQASAIIAGIVSALIVALFGYYMPSRTIRGTRELEKVLGFQEFLSRVEGDRLNRIVKTPEMFEKFLPYAMALGVEASWAKAFEGIYNKPPDWYGGPGGVHMFRPATLTSDLGRMSAVAATTMASAPRSSGGSGFGGGGSSGGGFGGGGGGGF
jgi:Predicted membrane protein (DUF2207) C-terminal domain/Predicted membrane protein (DUF2207) N-terminal domain